MEQKMIDLTGTGDGIFKFAITGGPCGGKSTAMARLREHFEERGYAVIVVPEVATILFGSGISIGENGVSVDLFQEMVLRQSIVQEQIATQAAIKYRDGGRRVVIFCDRGLLDGRAYVDDTSFEKIAEAVGYRVEELSESQYHGVYHLQSVAVGLPHLFSSENNKMRKENSKEAADLDHRSFLAWQSHPHHRVIDNSTDFGNKISRLIAEICSQVGDPVAIECERKFRVSSIPIESIPVPYHVATIHQSYLESEYPQVIRRVRMRVGELGRSYYYTEKSAVGHGQSLETERMISRREYNTLLGSVDRVRKQIVKKRVSFHWKGNFFELDYFSEPSGNILSANRECLLEVERTLKEHKESPVLPDFLNVIQEVTGKALYGNYLLALGQ